MKPAVKPARPRRGSRGSVAGNGDGGGNAGFIAHDANLPGMARSHLALVALASLAIATSAPLAKVASDVSPLAIGAGRTGVAAALILIAIPRATLAAVRALSARDRAKVLLAGAVLAAHFALFLAGLANTSLPAAVALVSLE